jgi:hypothetical protein
MKEINKQLEVFDRITFKEDTHTYYIDNVQVTTPSVTRIIKQFKREFNVNETASRMALKTGLTTEQIKEEWKRNRDCAATIGTVLHKYIESCYSNQEPELNLELISKLDFEEKNRLKNTLPTLISQFENFYKEHNYLNCIKNEFVVGDLNDTKICGTLDMLALNKQTNQLEILDFKTNKRMQKHTSFGKLFYPFEHLSEGEINEYTIQLNTYKFFIEKYTDLKINKLKLIWFNSNNETYQIFSLDNIQSNIKLMLDRVKSNALFQTD